MQEIHFQSGETEGGIESKSLVGAAIRLGWLLQRPDLTEYEREKYNVDFIRLIRKCLSDRRLPIGLDLLANRLQDVKVC